MEELYCTARCTAQYVSRTKYRASLSYRAEYEYSTSTVRGQNCGERRCARHQTRDITRTVVRLDWESEQNLRANEYGVLAP